MAEDNLQDLTDLKELQSLISAMVQDKNNRNNERRIKGIVDKIAPEQKFKLGEMPEQFQYNDFKETENLVEEQVEEGSPEARQAADTLDYGQNPIDQMVEEPITVRQETSTGTGKEQFSGENEKPSDGQESVFTAEAGEPILEEKTPEEILNRMKEIYETVGRIAKLEKIDKEPIILEEESQKETTGEAKNELGDNETDKEEKLAELFDKVYSDVEAFDTTWAQNCFQYINEVCKFKHGGTVLDLGNEEYINKINELINYPNFKEQSQNEKRDYIKQLMAKYVIRYTDSFYKDNDKFSLEFLKNLHRVQYLAARAFDEKITPPHITMDEIFELIYENKEKDAQIQASESEKGSSSDKSKNESKVEQKSETQENDIDTENELQENLPDFSFKEKALAVLYTIGTPFRWIGNKLKGLINKIKEKFGKNGINPESLNQEQETLDKDEQRTKKKRLRYEAKGRKQAEKKQKAEERRAKKEKAKIEKVTKKNNAVLKQLCSKAAWVPAQVFDFVAEQNGKGKNVTEKQLANMLSAYEQTETNDYNVEGGNQWRNEEAAKRVVNVGQNAEKQQATSTSKKTENVEQEFGDEYGD